VLRNERSLALYYPTVCNIIFSWSFLPIILFEPLFSLIFEHGETGKHDVPGNKGFR